MSSFERFLRQHWLGLAAFILYCIWFVVQLEEWKKHGSDYMLLVANFGITTILFVVLLVAIGRYWKDATRTKQIRANIKAKTGELVELVEKRKQAGGQAAVLWQFEACARHLIGVLEDTWYHWHQAGETLTRPIDTKVELKEWGTDNSSKILGELQNLKILYWHHLDRLKLDVPYFSSQVTQSGYPSEKEYQLVLADLREHAELLDKMAEKIWKSGHPVES